MLEVNLQSNIQQMTANLFGRLTSAELTRITVLALNKAIDGAVTETDRAIRAQYNIKRDDVRKAIGKPIYASQFQLTARFNSTGHRIPIYAFSPRPSEPGTGRPVSVSISKGGGRKSKSSWFIARMKSGHVGVYERTGNARLPIREVFTISVPEMLNKRELNQVVREKATDRFDKEFERLMKVMLKGGF